jgi:hypothetical protein
MADPSNPQTDLTGTLPYEILREILRQATFIPHEWDVSASSIDSGLFCSWDELQIQAWKEVLPLRKAIALVSRRWRAVALEFLYATYHDRPNGNLAPFTSLLSSNHHVGMLVRRLTIQYVHNSDKNAAVTTILRHCPNLLILSVIDSRYSTQFTPILWHPPILPRTLKQLDAGVGALSIESIYALLAHLPQLEILALYHIGGTSPLVKCTKTVLPILRILQLVFIPMDSESISQFILSLEVPLLSAMCIGVLEADQIPTLPKDLSERLDCLEFCIRWNKIDEWEAINFLHLRHLRLMWDHLRLSSFRSCLPMNQIVELTLSFRFLTPKALYPKRGELEQAMDFLLDLTMVPSLRSLFLDIEEAGWDRVEEQKREDQWLIAYFTALAGPFEQRGVDLWINRPHLRKESIPIRDMTDMCIY